MSIKGLERKCLHEIFEARAALFPTRTAASYEGESITYQELDRRANAVAGKLLARGTAPGDLVALYADKSIELIVGLVGILKANAGYVPLDPTYPPQRLRWIVENSGVRLAVVGPNVDVARLPDFGSLIDVPTEACPQDAVAPPRAKPRQSDSAYVIYTSGSTGTPKGVVVEHRSVVRLFVAVESIFDFDSTDVWSLFHSIGFDFSVWETWGALLHGGRLAIVPFQVSRSPTRFCDFLREQQVTVLNQTPSAFRSLLDVLRRDKAKDLQLRHVIFGGERLDVELLAPWFEMHGDERPALHNMYGITESTIHTTHRRLRADDATRHGESPIGSPLPHLMVHLVDSQLHPVAAGEEGEVLVEGDGLARGYLNNAALTEKRFPTLQLQSGYRKVYRSGDRAVLREGEYIYLGRTDDQFKVRGYRVEPHEIEMCLLQHPAIAAAAVLPRDFGDGDTRAVAFLAMQDTTANTNVVQRELASLAARSLPLFMRPSKYVCLHQLPLTPHGKIDRASLAAMSLQGPDDAPSAKTASTDYRFAVAEIWREILLEDVEDIDADFFDHGGTSLALLRMLSNIEKRFGVRIEPTTLLEGVTIRAIANILRSDSSTENETTGERMRM